MFKDIAIIILAFLMFSSCDFTSADEYYNKSIDLADEGKIEEAISSLDKAINKKSKYRPALTNRGYYKTVLGDIEGAIDDYKNILQFDPDNTLALFNMGILFSDLMQYEKAIYYYSKALDTEGALFSIPNDNGSLVFQANIDFKNFDSDMEYNIMDCEIYFMRGLDYLSVEKYDKAISDINKSLKANNSIQDCYFTLGKAYLGKKDSINACQNFIESAKLGDQKAREMLKKYCLEKNTSNFN